MWLLRFFNMYHVMSQWNIFPVDILSVFFTRILNVNVGEDVGILKFICVNADVMKQKKNCRKLGKRIVKSLYNTMRNA